MEPNNQIMTDLRDEMRKALIMARHSRVVRCNIANTLWLINCIIRAQNFAHRARNQAKRICSKQQEHSK